MSAAPILQSISQPVQPSPHFLALLSGLLNASNDDYDARLADLCEYAAACENVAAVTPFQASVNLAMRSRERERKAIAVAISKLPRVEPDASGAMVPADLGGYVDFYAVMGVVR